MNYLPNMLEQKTCYFDTGELDISLGLRENLEVLTEVYNDIQNLNDQAYLFVSNHDKI